MKKLNIKFETHNTQKNVGQKKSLVETKLFLVAGTGLEPMTFGL